jgi:citrate lyase subunit beta / citryl-CoA lyase
VKPIRIALFAPGSKDRVMSKALESGADAVILDLEDSVPVTAKVDARLLVSKVIADAAARKAAGPAIFVRTNGAATGLLADDLAAVVRAGLDAVLIPKAESVAEIRAAAADLDRLEAAAGMKAGSVEIILQIESALGVYRCFDLIQATPRVTATCLGSARDGDLQTSLGCAWSIDGPELLYSKSKVLLDTRAAGAYPLDGVFADLNDEEGLIRDSVLSSRIGYLGRTVIHPKQIAPVRKAYAVPEADVIYYREVVSEFEAVEKTGAAAAITVNGKLVDYAMYQRAKSVLELAQLDR